MRDEAVRPAGGPGPAEAAFESHLATVVRRVGLEPRPGQEGAR